MNECKMCKSRSYEEFCSLTCFLKFHHYSDESEAILSLTSEIAAIRNRLHVAENLLRDNQTLSLTDTKGIEDWAKRRDEYLKGIEQ